MQNNGTALFGSSDLKHYAICMQTCVISAPAKRGSAASKTKAFFIFGGIMSRNDYVGTDMNLFCSVRR